MVRMVHGKVGKISYPKRGSCCQKCQEPQALLDVNESKSTENLYCAKIHVKSSHPHYYKKQSSKSHSPFNGHHTRGPERTSSVQCLEHLGQGAGMSVCYSG